MKIGGMTCKEWNDAVSRTLHGLEKFPYSCPPCAKTSDSKLRAVKVDGEIWLGGCSECSDEQSKQVRDYVTGEDLK